VTYDFNAARRGTAEPPGGLPPAGSGFEADPFSPAGSWIQSSRFLDALARRLGRRSMIVVVVLIALFYFAGFFR
jgi:hypothetical protein